MVQIHHSSPVEQCAYFERDTRYYVISLVQDMFDDWLVTRVYGGKGRRSRHPHVRHEGYKKYEDALLAFQEYCNYRAHRKYQLIN